MVESLEAPLQSGAVAPTGRHPVASGIANTKNTRSEDGRGVLATAGPRAPWNKDAVDGCEWVQDKDFNECFRYILWWTRVGAGRVAIETCSPEIAGLAFAANQVDLGNLGDIDNIQDKPISAPDDEWMFQPCKRPQMNPFFADRGKWTCTCSPGKAPTPPQPGNPRGNPNADAPADRETDRRADNTELEVAHKPRQWVSRRQNRGEARSSETSSDEEKEDNDSISVLAVLAVGAGLITIIGVAMWWVVNRKERKPNTVRDPMLLAGEASVEYKV